MHEYVICLMLISAGVLLSVLCVFAGAFIMYRGKVQPGTGEGFIRDPKGDVFTISDSDALDFPGVETEPNVDEQNVLKRTERFLRSIGGGNA
jgi:hypothetical protein